MSKGSFSGRTKHSRKARGIHKLGLSHRKRMQRKGRSHPEPKLGPEGKLKELGGGGERFNENLEGSVLRNIKGDSMM